MAADLARSWQTVVVLGAFLALTSALAPGDEVTLKNGMKYSGRLAKISSIAESPTAPAKPAAGAVDTRLIVMIDDDLRRTYFSTYQVQGVNAGLEQLVNFKIPQRRAGMGNRLKAVGPLIVVEPFDQWGRRRLQMMTAKGPIDVVQGITEITPVWTKVEGILGNQAIIWDMRIATSSIPRDLLSKIFQTYLDDQNPNHRLQIIKFYIQSDRYDDAREQLERAIKDFPDLSDLKGEVDANRQLAAKRMIEEIERRRKAGQHQFAFNLLQKFPTKDVAGTTLLQVRELLAEYEKQAKQKEKALKLFDELSAQTTYEEYKKILADIRKELADELNINTLTRMADFLRLGEDTKLEPDQRLAICIVGWLTGSAPPGEENLEFALQMYRARAHLRSYLQDNTAPERRQVLADLANQRSIGAKESARIVGMMKPPHTAQANQGGPPGLFTIRIPGMAKTPDVVYHVQLPPEYDPYRRYPTIVTLHGSGTTAMQQVDWWAGSHVEQLGMRTGQATRRGYIVISPEWTRPHQSAYEFSPREHDIVLRSLRDACRKFSINTDRVYLSGHSIGGDCAWDIALAHPDLFAGAIPVVATSDKFINRYWENARQIPLYFVCGELDGDKLGTNATDLDRYMKTSGIDCTVVEYLGRGHEHFIDEIQRIFDWCDLHERSFFPRKIEYTTMRLWDNYCFWLEFDQLPPATMVNPAAWPPAGGVRPSLIKADARADNLSITSGAKKMTVYLCPELIDLEKPFTISYNGKGKRITAQPTVETLMEDVRTRGDRQHPFWVKVSL